MSPTITRTSAHHCCLVLLVLAFTWQAEAAFEGFGSSTPGGNSGFQIVVTSLADSGPGTLREALARANNHRIVFAVGGTIHLKNRLEIRRQGFITIDGSTAPAPGITLANHSLYVRNSHDIIITNMRVRNSRGDGILVWDRSYNIVIDHCSVTDAGDENINISEGTRDVTVSWCIIGDTRPDSFALKSKGMLIASFKRGPVTHVSLHHNLFVNQFQRSPQISTPGLFDMRNNVIRDWGAYGTRVRSGAWGNIVNNVFATTSNLEKAIVLGSTAGNVFVRGNRNVNDGDLNGLSTSVKEFDVAPVNLTPVNDVEDQVARGAGASPRDRIDTLFAGTSDSRFLSAAQNNRAP